MKRALVYSHDTFGLGNIRRMLAICEHVLECIPDLSILLITGSPMVHSFRLPQRLDYVKIPSITRPEREQYAPKFLDIEMDDMMALRSSLILSTVINFDPDLLLIDKKPQGVHNELESAFDYLRLHRPATKVALILRDILDSPAATRRTWRENGYYPAIDAFYDLLLVLGTPEVFDTAREYGFPASIADKVRYCGYIGRSAGLKDRGEIRRELRMSDGERLALVTVGGGEDGYRVLETYIAGLTHLPDGCRIHSLIIGGPELPAAQRAMIAQAAARHPRVTVLEFTDDMMSYIAASDVVVSMGGYNTICEILTAGRRAVIVPRARPVAEQWIRASRMADLGLFSAIHPDDLTPRALLDAVVGQIRSSDMPGSAGVDLGALPQVAGWVATLLRDAEREQSFHRANDQLIHFPVHQHAPTPRVRAR